MGSSSQFLAEFGPKQVSTDSSEGKQTNKYFIINFEIHVLIKKSNLFIRVVKM